MSRRQFGYIRTRGKAKYQALYYVHGQRYSLGIFRTKGEADAALARVQADLRSETWTDPNRGLVTVRVYADKWMRDRVDLRPRTVNVYRSSLDRHILPEFGETMLVRVHPESVRAWYAATSRQSPAAAKTAYRLLRAILNTAIADGCLVRNPCRVKGASTDKAPERKPLTPFEVEKLALALPEQLRALVYLAAGGGLRRGEVLGLVRSDVNLETGLIRIERALIEPSSGKLTVGPTKNGEQRALHLAPDVAEYVRSHIERFVGPEAHAPLFTGRNGVVLRPGSLEYFWRKARGSCGLTHVHFHDLRHFHATQYSAAGASLREVMARGGWKSVSMVARYQHATPERDAELVRRLPPIPMTGHENASE